MSATGASESQIEAAARRKLAADIPGFMLGVSPRAEDGCRAFILRAAEHLVDPDQCIVERSDVAAVVAFYRAMLAEATAASDGTVDDAATVRARMVEAWESVTLDVLERLTAVLGEQS